MPLVTTLYWQASSFNTFTSAAKGPGGVAWCRSMLGVCVPVHVWDDQDEQGDQGTGGMVYAVLKF